MSRESRSRKRRYALALAVIVVVAVFWDHVVVPRLGDLTAFLAALTFALLAFAGRWTYDRLRRDGE